MDRQSRFFKIRGKKDMSRGIRENLEDDIIPAPFIMVGATDSRNFRSISNGVLNFCPITDGKAYHGIDERLPIKDFQRAIQFYTILING